jgi:hypothetical protein
MRRMMSLISTGASIASRYKRYVVWFYLLNLLLAWFGATAFSRQVHAIMDFSLYSDKLLHGFDPAVLNELLLRPEFGSRAGATAPALMFAALFFLATLLLMPGVLLGYASDHGLPREEFFRTCGRNLWRFARLFLFFAVIVGLVVGTLFGVQQALLTAAENSLYERLPFFTGLLGTIVIFLVLTTIRIWFDLAQIDVVLRDQRAVRKSVAAGFRSTLLNLGRLLGSYVVISLVAAAVLVVGILLWHAIVPPASVLGAFIVSQATLLFLLATRFWQRATAVGFYLRAAAEIVEMQPVHIRSVTAPQPGSGI